MTQNKAHIYVALILPLFIVAIFGVAYFASRSQASTVTVPDPTFATGVAGSIANGLYSGGSCGSVRVHAYKELNGQKVFSRAYATGAASSCFGGESDFKFVSWNWSPVAGVAGYRVLRGGGALASLDEESPVANVILDYYSGSGTDYGYYKDVQTNSYLFDGQDYNLAKSPDNLHYWTRCPDAACGMTYKSGDEIPAPDTVSPTVSSFTSTPASPLTPNENVTFAVDASDNVGISKVEFYWGTNQPPLGTDTTAPYTYSQLAPPYNYTPSNSYTLTARAIDTAGNHTDRDLTVTVRPLFPADTTPPTASFSYPANNSSAQAGSGVPMYAIVNDSGTGVAGVQFKVDGANLGAEVTQWPHTATWDVPAGTTGAHVISAVVRDGAGNVTTITTTVNVITTGGQTGTVDTWDGSWNWSGNSGWIGYTSDNLPGASADADGNIHGYGWNSNNSGTVTGGLGWLRMDPVGLTPAGVNNDGVKIGTVINKTAPVTGWARFCSVFQNPSLCSGTLRPDSERGGWDGWVEMTDVLYHASTTPSGTIVPDDTANGIYKGTFSGYAWGDLNVGWVDMGKFKLGPGGPGNSTKLVIQIVGANLDTEYVTVSGKTDCKTASCEYPYSIRTVGIVAGAKNPSNKTVTWSKVSGACNGYIAPAVGSGNPVNTTVGVDVGDTCTIKATYGSSVGGTLIVKVEGAGAVEAVTVPGKTPTCSSSIGCTYDYTTNTSNFSLSASNPNSKTISWSKESGACGALPPTGNGISYGLVSITDGNICTVKAVYSGGGPFTLTKTGGTRIQVVQPQSYPTIATAPVPVKFKVDNNHEGASLVIHSWGGLWENGMDNDACDEPVLLIGGVQGGTLDVNPKPVTLKFNKKCALSSGISAFHRPAQDWVIKVKASKDGVYSPVEDLILHYDDPSTTPR